MSNTLPSSGRVHKHPSDWGVIAFHLVPIKILGKLTTLCLKGRLLGGKAENKYLFGLTSRTFKGIPLTYK